MSLENQLESARQQASNEARKAGELAASVKDWRNKHAELDAQLTRLKAARNKDVADLKAAKQTSDSLRQALDKARTEKEAKDGQLAKAREEVSITQPAPSYHHTQFVVCSGSSDVCRMRLAPQILLDVCLGQPCGSTDTVE